MLVKTDDFGARRCTYSAIVSEIKINEEDEDEEWSKLEARHGEFDFGCSITFSTL